ncbi:MAG TPA: hypothetical protein PLI95_03935 [Polyangiaceae bacterium]|nr:hypothetical protein [Polyangiaceae bacterium]
MRPGSMLCALTLLAWSGSAIAQPYAQPPDRGQRGYRAYDEQDPPRPAPSDCWCEERSWARRSLSPFRVHIGAAGRVVTEEITPGMMTAIDIGRGPAGFRATALWARVGSDDGLAQYTGELTLDFGRQSAWRPVLGAGGGFARTYRVDDQGNRTSGGASLGLGVVRAALEYRLPIEGTDSRAGVNVMGVLPAVRGEGAPDVKGWVVVGATLGVGF